MKVALLVASVAVALLVVLPGYASAQPPIQDSVVGSASVDADFAFTWTFDVRSGPLGESPSGDVSVRVGPEGPVFVSGSIECLVVSGSTATFAGTWLPNPWGVTDFGVTVEDTGPGASTPDLLGAVTTTNAPPGCDASHLVKLPLTTGDIVVTDAQPLPLSKDQCKNGGWKAYGVFKNQGDCVSFVATGGRNGPAGAKP
jgi:hypothetical protein